MTVVVFDNGAYTLKAGVAGVHVDPKLIPNYITRGKSDRRTFIGDQLATCRDFSGLYYRLGFEKGILTNWEVEKQVWDRTFSKEVLHCSTQDSSLILTEPYFNLPNVQEMYNEIIFEEYDFKSYLRSTPAQLSTVNNVSALFGDHQAVSSPECVLVVDSGYSFTHCVPMCRGKIVAEGVKRINVGGKLLTNTLKELISFRYYDMMEETYLVNDVKETCCFVSQDFMRDLENARKPQGHGIAVDYVLPDFSTNKKGYIKPRSETGTKSLSSNNEQLLTLNNERIAIPEILFHPSDIGMPQSGIVEAMVESVQSCPEELHGPLYANIVLIGGNANFRGFKERIERDLRQLVPSEYMMRVSKPIE